MRSGSTESGSFASDTSGQGRALYGTRRHRGSAASAIWLAGCLLCAFGGLAHGGATSVYVLQPGSSTIVQTGGIAGVHRTYTITGTFRLTVDVKAGTAFFSQVDANAVDDSPYQHALDPNEVFNLTELVGTVADGGKSIRFAGQANDGSSVLITLTFSDGTVTLQGQTTPPAHSADFFLFTLDAVAQRKYAGGTGEPNEPYLIETAEHLVSIDAETDTRNKHFLLLSDIDLDPNLPRGRVFHHPVISVFSGSFDGGGHRIQKLVIDCSEVGRLGLFGHVTGEAQLHRLYLENVTVHSRTSGAGYGTGTLAGTNDGLVEDCHALGSVMGYEYVGGLVGDSLGTIRGCSAYVVVEGDKSYRYAGGLVGWNCGLIVNCRAAGSVNAPPGSSGVGGLVGMMGYPGDVDMGGERTINSCSAGWRVSGGRDCRQVGGLVGLCAQGTVTNCYATVELFGGQHCSRFGGLVGQNGTKYDSGTHEGIIRNCYASGGISTWPDGEEVGGLVGRNEAGQVSRSYWDTKMTDQGSDGGTGASTAQMQKASTFLDAGWDFMGETKNGTEDVWWILEGRDYPRLWWERVLGDDFEDGKAEPLWMLYEPEPEAVRLTEVNSRLEVEAVAQSENVDAIYVPNGWRLDATKDFALRVDFHFSKRDTGDGRVTLGVVPSLDPGGMQWAELEAGCLNMSPFFLYEVQDGPETWEQQAARFADNGTLFMSYNSGTDELYFSSIGYGKANAWQTMPGLLQGRWASGPVYVVLMGGSEGMALKGTDAWLDNFVLHAGLVQSVEPAALPDLDDSDPLVEFP
jgi:hypothetical protein